MPSISRRTRTPCSAFAFSAAAISSPSRSRARMKVQTSSVRSAPAMTSSAARRACGAVGVDREPLVGGRGGQAHRAAEPARPERRRLGLVGRARIERRRQQRRRVAHAQLAAAEHQVERHRDVRHQRQRDDPGDRRRRIAPLRQRARHADVDDEAERDDDAVQGQPVALDEADDESSSDAHAAAAAKTKPAGLRPGGLRCRRERASAHHFLRYLRSAAICAAIVANSPCALAKSMSLLAFFIASSAACLASPALASSRSLPRIAVSASTVTEPGWISRMPPATKTNSSSSLSARWMRTAPGLMRVMSGVWRG